MNENIRVITPDSKEWPVGFYALPEADRPEQLWAIGQPLTQRPSVAIVGARAATSYGEHVTHELINGLADNVSIVSGAAYGIDAAAHHSALARGLNTVAYLAGGVDRPYPLGNAHLIQRITEHGTVLSESAPGEAPTKWKFLRRNRLIAAHAWAMVVVEAGFRSGSLNAAGHAHALDRPLGAVPGPITSVASAGCHRLIAERTARIITSGEDVVALMNR